MFSHEVFASKLMEHINSYISFDQSSIHTLEFYLCLIRDVCTVQYDCLHGLNDHHLAVCENMIIVSIGIGAFLLLYCRYCSLHTS